MRNKKFPILLIILGIIFFLVFAYDIENDRDYFTWLWLLASEILFLISLRYWIMDIKG